MTGNQLESMSSMDVQHHTTSGGLVMERGPFFDTISEADKMGPTKSLHIRDEVMTENKLGSVSSVNVQHKPSSDNTAMVREPFHNVMVEVDKHGPRDRNLDHYELLTVMLKNLVESRKELIDRRTVSNIDLVNQNILQALRVLEKRLDRRRYSKNVYVNERYLQTLTHLAEKIGCLHKAKSGEVKCPFRLLHQMISKKKDSILVIPIEPPVSKTSGREIGMPSIVQEERGEAPV
ncbi:MAG: hypothetical protein LQ352_005167 [Teloschistes flavicans]|nr:MAG: hypothetical protein LQ352_005167 [Teloschistes flavicans]